MNPTRFARSFVRRTEIDPVKGSSWGGSQFETPAPVPSRGLSEAVVARAPLLESPSDTGDSNRKAQGVLPSRRRLVQIAPSQPRLRSRCETPAPKRILDVTFALVVLTAGLPVLCLIALAIALESRGSVLFSQVRVGFRGRTFRMYKFRSMVCDAERDTGPVWASETDPRVTRVGSILRRTHLDELPQLFNVLRGEMSVVGPRPERPALVERLSRLVPGYDDRWIALPGITGLAQVRHVYDQSTKTVRQKLRYDRCYIRRAGSLALDLKIMAATVALMLGAGPRKPTPVNALPKPRPLARKEALSKP